MRILESRSRVDYRLDPNEQVTGPAFLPEDFQYVMVLAEARDDLGEFLRRSNPAKARQRNR